MDYTSTNQSNELQEDQKYTMHFSEYEGLYRIKALRNIGDDVKAGENGGLVENPNNLSQFDDCWIYPDARVIDNARVTDDAKIQGESCVKNDARVRNNVIIKGKVYIEDQAGVFNAAILDGNISIKDDACIEDDVKLMGHIRVNGRANIYGNSIIDNSETFDDYGYIEISHGHHSNVIMTRQPLFLQGFTHSVYIYDTHMRIGCQCRSHFDWARLSELDVSGISNSKDGELWRTLSTPVLAICREHALAIENDRLSNLSPAAEDVGHPERSIFASQFVPYRPSFGISPRV